MAQDTPHPLSPQDTLATLMIATSVSDENIRTSELVTIQSIINHLPIFAGYDTDRLPGLSRLVFELFEEEDGLDALFGLVRANLPEALNETAYALCVDVTAADGANTQAELRFLQELREELEIDTLAAAAIERAARARHRTL